MMEHITEHTIEDIDTGEGFKVTVTWDVRTHRERYEIGDGYEWRTYQEWMPRFVQHEDGSLYFLDEQPSEDWHYTFDKADFEGEIQP